MAKGIEGTKEAKEEAVDNAPSTPPIPFSRRDGTPLFTSLAVPGISEDVHL